MAKFVVVKLTGEDSYLLVDVGAMTVERMQGIAPDAFGYTADALDSGATFVSGVDVAVVAETRADAFAGKFDT